MSVDLNTIVSGVILSVLIYVARKLSRQDVLEEKVRAQGEAQKETRARVIAVEEKVQSLEVDVAHLRPKRS